MNKVQLLATVALLGFATGVMGAPKEEVQAAIERLEQAESYAWKTSSDSSGRFNTNVEGRTQKGGYTYISMSFGDRNIEAYVKGESGAVKTQDGWQSLANVGGEERRGRFLARMLQNYRTPAAEAAELLKQATDLTESDGACSGTLSEDAVRSLLSFRRRGDGNGPQVNNASGSVKFWTKDGVLSKYEYTVRGTVTFNNQDRDIDRTMTIEISDVGTAKVEVDEQAKQYLD